MVQDTAGLTNTPDSVQLIFHLLLLGSIGNEISNFLQFSGTASFEPTGVVKYEPMSGWIYDLVLDLVLSTLDYLLR
jgi:hypothetical protein